MRIRNHRLYGDDGRAIPFDETPNKSAHGLDGGAPKFIVIHYTAGGSARSAIDSFNNPARKASAHLVIAHDGSITQMGRFNDRLWHAGASRWKDLTGLNSHAVGIEIVNWGWLKGGPGNWRSWAGTRLPDDRVIVAEHRNHPGWRPGWEIFEEAQIATTAGAVAAIAEGYGLGAEALLGHDDISPERKQDPGPAWEMERFRVAVFGRAEEEPETARVPRYRVTAHSGLNMRVGAGIEHGKIETLKNGTEVALVERLGTWWLVAVIKGGVEDATGWVHSRWLAPV